MEKYKRSVFYSSLVVMALAIIVTFQEGPTLPIGEQFPYYLGRFLIIGSLGILLPFVKQNPFSQKTNLGVAIIFSLYSIHGQYFNPWYLICFIHTKYALSFLYPIKRRIFTIYMLISTSAFAVMLFWRFDIFLRWAANPVKEDIFFTLFCAMACAILANHFFTADRTYREETIRKFGLIGAQSATILHDIKGMMAAPRIYAETLTQIIEKQPENTRAQEAAMRLQESLDHFNSVLVELNRMSSLHIQTPETFEFSDLLKEIAESLSMERKNLPLENHVFTRLHIEKAHLKSIIFNIVLNSMQAFRNKKTSNPLIKVQWDEKKGIVFSDNGGGFNEAILKNLEKEDYNYEQVSGTGLGLYMINEGIKSLGGRATFQNSSRGAEVTLYLPQKTILKTAPLLQKLEQLA